MYFSCYFASLQSKDLLLCISCVISRVLVLELQDSTLLDDGVFFDLIFEEFLGNVFVFVIRLMIAWQCGSKR